MAESDRLPEPCCGTLGAGESMTRNGRRSTLFRIPRALIGQVIDYYIGQAAAGAQRDELFAAIISALGDFPVVAARISPTHPHLALVVVDADDAESLASLIPDAVRVAARTRDLAAFIVSAGGPSEGA